jgi:hypothetical protein
MPPDGARVAFLFLGESLLIPHLLPIAEALARIAPEVRIELWVRDPETETFLRERVGGSARIRRAPGFGTGRPQKLLLLARLLPHLWKARAVVCAEQTSLWIPALLPGRWRFVKTSHGVGSVSARDDRRRRAAWRMLVPSALERRTYLARGLPPERVVATGYVKASFQGRSFTPHFPQDRPIILYTPHWQRHRSSWWDWGRRIVTMLAGQERFNVILAPHQRLIERDPEVRAVLAQVADLPHVHADLDSFAMVDGSYTAAADIYLGDTSSQVVEFLALPRPCVFLNSQRIDWRATDDHDFWTCGEVVDDPDRIMGALDEAISVHGGYHAVQSQFAEASLGDVSAEAPMRAARVVLEAIGRQPSQETTGRPRIVTAQA